MELTEGRVRKNLKLGTRDGPRGRRCANGTQVPLRGGHLKSMCSPPRFGRNLFLIHSDA